MIRVLIVDDSTVAREYLSYLVQDDPGLEVIGTARNGQEAVQLTVDKRPDVLVMDLHMPVMDGIEATRQIMKQAPTPIILATASLEEHEQRLGFHAIEAGALTLMDKPPGPTHPGYEAAAGRLIQTIKLMAEVKVVRRWERRATGVPVQTQQRARAIQAIAIGASTGGPQLLAELLRGLDAHFTLPILIVQHIVPGFVGGLTQWLNGITGMTVKVAESGEVIKPGHVYLAPDNVHMGVTNRRTITLLPGTENGGLCPSATHLFRSVAEAYGRSGLGILLTGMGRDGADGLKAMREAGGLTVAQNEESCVVFGMPAEAINLGAVDQVLSPAQIADLMRQAATDSSGGAHA